MDEAIIWVSIISGLFGILGLELLTHNWFRKERFKLEAYNMKKQNDLQLKKMARDMGIDMKKPPVEAPVSHVTPDLLTTLAPILKNLPPESIPDLIDRFLPAPDDEGGGGGGLADQIGDFIANNPEIVQGFLKGVKGGASQESTTSQV